MNLVGRGIAIAGLLLACTDATNAAPFIVTGTIDRLGGNAVGNSIFDGFTTTEVDYIPFSVAGGTGTVTIDVRSYELNSTTVQEQDINGDGLISSIDPTIYLFRDDGSLDITDYTLQTSEFSFDTLGDGSISFLDPYLELVNLLPSGNYLLAIGSDDLTLAAALAGSYSQSIGPIGPNDTVSSFGAYQVTINSIPEPASAVMVLAALFSMHRLRRGIRRTVR